MKLTGLFAVLGVFLLSSAAQAECSYGAHAEKLVQNPIVLLPPVDGEGDTTADS